MTVFGVLINSVFFSLMMGWSLAIIGIAIYIIRCDTAPLSKRIIKSVIIACAAIAVAIYPWTTSLDPAVPVRSNFILKTTDWVCTEQRDGVCVRYDRK